MGRPRRLGTAFFLMGPASFPTPRASPDSLFCGLDPKASGNTPCSPSSTCLRAVGLRNHDPAIANVDAIDFRLPYRANTCGQQRPCLRERVLAGRVVAELRRAPRVALLNLIHQSAPLRKEGVVCAPGPVLVTGVGQAVVIDAGGEA